MTDPATVTFGGGTAALGITDARPGRAPVVTFSGEARSTGQAPLVDPPDGYGFTMWPRVAQDFPDTVTLDEFGRRL